LIMTAPPAQRRVASALVDIDPELCWMIVRSADFFKGRLSQVAFDTDLPIELVERIMSPRSWLQFDRQEMIRLRTEIASGEPLQQIADRWGVPVFAVVFVRHKSEVAARKVARRLAERG
jgi:hypothetical protein